MERERHIDFCFTYLCTHGLLPACALTRESDPQPRRSVRCCHQLNYPARASFALGAVGTNCFPFAGSLQHTPSPGMESSLLGHGPLSLSKKPKTILSPSISALQTLCWGSAETSGSCLSPWLLELLHLAQPSSISVLGYSRLFPSACV